jgi:hypothetical protein
MDVTRTLLPGTTPLAWRRRALPAGLLVATGSGGGSAASPAIVATAASPRDGHAHGSSNSSAFMPELAGAPDGADVVLPSGVRVRRTTIGGRHVSQGALLQAIRGIQQLPLQHQLLLARSGIAVELLPVTQLEQVEGTSQPVLGATAVNQDSDGRWVPTRIRVATDSPISARGGVNAIAEVAQHEIGHAISVMTTQNRSEDAAIRYAATY